MGFFDRFKKKDQQQVQTEKPKDSNPPPAGKRVKKYTSDGKPVYE